MTQWVAVHDHYRDGRMPSPVERLGAPLVSVEVCGKQSTQAIVEPDHRIRAEAAPLIALDHVP
ncbi:MAG TPA: hypothetical protein VMA77_19735, partial [Solirubrobacteraceae bacterium]|nr:hypothetical protein [Solirubrobacteraceae bacterium]